MTKSEFVDKVASSSGLSKKDADNAVNAVISTIESSLRSGEDVNFTGFGKFHVAERGARLAAAVAARESQIVLGIDPDPSRLWPDPREAVGEQRERLALALVDTADAAGAPGPAPAAAEAAAAVLVHCRALIDAAGPACVAVKPQLACFERLGSAG